MLFPAFDHTGAYAQRRPSSLSHLHKTCERGASLEKGHGDSRGRARRLFKAGRVG